MTYGFALFPGQGAPKGMQAAGADKGTKGLRIDCFFHSEFLLFVSIRGRKTGQNENTAPGLKAFRGAPHDGKQLFWQYRTGHAPLKQHAFQQFLPRRTATQTCCAPFPFMKRRQAARRLRALCETSYIGLYFAQLRPLVFPPFITLSFCFSWTNPVYAMSSKFATLCFPAAAGPGTFCLPP